MKKIKKCCLNCAFCVKKPKQVQGIQPDDEILDNKLRAGDFSELERNDRIRCYIGYWEYSKVHGQPPKKEELENRLDCKEGYYYDYRAINKKPLLVLKREVELRSGEKILKWTRISAIAAIIAALTSLPFIAKPYHYLGHVLKTSIVKLSSCVRVSNSIKGNTK